VVTNIDADHMEHLRPATSTRLHAGLRATSCSNLPFYGRRRASASTTPSVRAILPRVERRVTTYGLDAGAPTCGPMDVALRGRPHALRRAARHGGRDRRCRSRSTCAGVHNVLNALAAIAVAARAAA
jgi:UDP-N-acetylmuramate-alanine ligase